MILVNSCLEIRMGLWRVACQSSARAFVYLVLYLQSTYRIILCDKMGSVGVGVLEEEDEYGTSHTVQV